MIPRLLTLLLLVATAHGQNMLVGNGAFEIQVAPAATFNPTNIAGYPIAGYWDTSVVGLSTNAGVVQWPDLSTNGFTLTNVTTARFPITIYGGLNGSNTISFTNAATVYLQSALLSNAPNCDVVLLCAHWRYMANKRIYSSFDGSYRSRLVYTDPNHNSMYGWGTQLHGGDLFPTNGTWQVLHDVYNGASSAMYTNNVLAYSGNSGAPPATNYVGFVLNAAVNGGSSGWMEVVEAIVYNTNLTAEARTNVYNHLKAKWPGANLP